VFAHALLALISPRFAYGSEVGGRPILTLVSLQVLAGVFYLTAVWGLGNRRHGMRLFVWVVAVGAVMRVSMLTSTPMYEDDFYRYLWDGAVAARGMNPYAWAPADVLRNGDVPAELKALAAESGQVALRINHPDLRTIYPPTAQLLFALSHRVAPWSLTGWRGVLLILDVVVLALVCTLLRRLDLPLLWGAIYWWNPLLVKEVFNSAHMDVLVLPFVLGAVLLAGSRRNVCGAGVLALGTGARLWPVVLLPLVVRPLASRPRRAVLAVLLFAVLAGVVLGPALMAGLKSDSGLFAYGRRWEMNDALFMLFVWGSRCVVWLFGAKPDMVQIGARLIAAVILAASVAWLARKPVAGLDDLSERCLLTIAAVFLLSPTQFPWYYVWMIPLLAARPRLSLLLLTVTLPLYYLRFYFVARGSVSIFDYGIVWVEYVPIWCLLIREWYVSRRSGPGHVAERAP